MMSKILESPQNLVFFVTDRCNLQCSHCFYWHSLASSVAELDLEQIKKIVVSFKKPLYKVTLTGGEPFLREDLVQICEIFSNFSKTENIYIITNGYFPGLIYDTIKKVLEITKLKLHLKVSLDGLRQTHNHIRQNKDSFDNAIKTIWQLKRLEKKSNFNLQVTTTISRENLKELIDLARFVRNELKVTFHVFEIARDISFFGQISKDIEIKEYGPKNKALLLSIEQLKRLKSEINKFYLVKPTGSIINLLYRIYYANTLKVSIESMLKRKRIHPCYAGNSIGVIYANGNVSLCEVTRPIGNLKEMNFDFGKIWHSREANKRRNQINSCFCSNTCYLFASRRRNKLIEGIKGICFPKLR